MIRLRLVATVLWLSTYAEFLSAAVEPHVAPVPSRFPPTCADGPGPYFLFVWTILQPERGVLCRTHCIEQSVAATWQRSFDVYQRCARHPKCETTIRRWQSITARWLRSRTWAY